MATRPVTVAVTGLNATDNPAPGLPILRSLRHGRKWNGTLIGLAYDTFDTGIYDADVCDKVFLIPYPNAGEGNIMSRIAEIHKRVPIDLLIPTLDSEQVTYERLTPELNKLGIKTFLPTPAQLKMRSKALLADFCHKHGIDVPKTRVINDPKQIPAIIKELSLPIVVKGVFYEAYVCHSEEEALIHFHKLRVKWGLPIILQEMLPGEEYDVACLGDGHGGLVGAVAMRKLRVTDKGKAWAGVTILDPELLTLSKKIIAKIGWRGPCELEFLKDTRTGRYALIEINPRFPSWIYLSAGAGVNLPQCLARLALGRKVAPVGFAPAGVTFVRHATDLICPLSYLESLTVFGELDLSEKEA